MRKTFKLTEIERHDFQQLNRKSLTNQAVPGEAWAFWKAVAVARGLDYKTLIGKDWAAEFSGLPLDHGKPWCYPLTLKCQHLPPQTVSL